MKFVRWDWDTAVRGRDVMCTLFNELELRAGHVYSPHEFLSLSLIVHLLYGHVVLLTPRHGYTRIQVVQLRRAQSYVLVFILQEKIKPVNKPYTNSSDILAIFNLLIHPQAYVVHIVLHY